MELGSLRVSQAVAARCCLKLLSSKDSTGLHILNVACTWLAGDAASRLGTQPTGTPPMSLALRWDMQPALTGGSNAPLQTKVIKQQVCLFHCFLSPEP